MRKWHFPMPQLQELLKRLYALPLTAGKALQTVSTTRHLSPSDSTITRGGSHLLANATLALRGQDAPLTRDTSPGHWRTHFS